MFGYGLRTPAWLRIINSRPSSTITNVCQPSPEKRTSITKAENGIKIINKLSPERWASEIFHCRFCMPCWLSKYLFLGNLYTSTRHGQTKRKHNTNNLCRIKCYLVLETRKHEAKKVTKNETQDWSPNDGEIMMNCDIEYSRYNLFN